MEKAEKSERRYRENAKEEGGLTTSRSTALSKSYTSRKQEAGGMRREVRRIPLTAAIEAVGEPTARNRRFSC
jgi:hypothetical protein